jgi:hypothetical protein
MIATPPADAYRRRDLNVATIVQAGTEPGSYDERAVVFSGVFTPDGGVWTVPVVIAPGGVVTMDNPAAAETLRQGFQIYHSAKVGLYHRATREMHVVMFGGITVLEHNAATGLFTQDNQAPFTNQCGVVVRRADGRFQQHFLPTRFPLIQTTDGKELRFGTNAEFFAAPGLPRMNSKVLDLTLIRSNTVIGHIFGGIVSDAGNGGNTAASGRVFEVRLRPVAAESQLAIHQANGQVNLSWQGTSGWSYLLEAGNDLSTWMETAEPHAGLPETMEWSEPMEQPRRFYRLLEGRQSQPPTP